MSPSAVLVDSNVLLDVLTEDSRWFSWSAQTLARVADEAVLAINPIIYAEVSIRFARIEDLEEALEPHLFELPRPAARRFRIFSIRRASETGSKPRFQDRPLKPGPLKPGFGDLLRVRGWSVARPGGGQAWTESVVLSWPRFAA